MKTEKGITLIELIIALALATLLMTSGTQTFLLTQKIWAKQDKLTEGIYSLYIPMSIIERDARRAQEMEIVYDRPNYKQFYIFFPVLDQGKPKVISYIYRKNAGVSTLTRNSSIIAENIKVSVKKEEGKGVYDDIILQRAGLEGVDITDLNLGMDMYYLFTFTNEDPDSFDFSKSASLAVSPRNWFIK